ncbi:AzlD domain-containing protein [Brenneria tiliae]|uniref:AzlD domain-containing protein n=1 Tax=Brenneria tiliae TaxID=2914984 RepID=A0ABT0MYM4_9GAMM|nr:AzlD domain-containing protein [Brenneria tiliae]MCL2894941.1 AzlD domain-containing protein [Brenneria tiliae]
MMLSSDLAWIAVIGMALITYLTRALPFAIRKKSKANTGERENGSPVLAALGPSLLAAITVVTVIPGLRDAIESGISSQLSYLVGVVTTLLILRLSNNSGVAVISGVGAYACIFYLTSMLR